MRNCDIIIPVFNAFDCLEKCLESVLRHTDLRNNRIIIIDDKSDDERIIPFIEDFISRKKQRIVLLKNENNLGFIKTVNIGMKFSGSDVLLLNSDTEVADNWLDEMQKCACVKERTATVTPLSNNAGIVSVDSISYRDYANIPKGESFCLYIKREALDTVGLFDEESYETSQDAEEDFFYRCINHGFRHVLCDSVIICHKGSQSMRDNYQQTHKKKQKLLEKKYPFYKSSAEKWELCNPIEYINKNINLNLCVNNGKSGILIIIHLWEVTPDKYKTIGGTSLHVYDVIRKLKGSYNFHVLSPFNGMYRLCSYWDTGNESFEIFSAASQHHASDYFNSDYSKMLDEIIDSFGIDIIHIHHMIGHYFDIVDIVKSKKTRLIVSLHDFFSVCPRINKINYKNSYCGNPENRECDFCLESYANENYDIKGIKDIAAWRKAWGLLFSLADKVIAPSEAARDEIMQQYKNISIEVIEHGIDIYCEKRELDIDTDEEYHAAFVGFLTEIKGKDIVERLIDYSHRLNDNVYFHLFGYMDSDILQIGYKRFINHGAYNRNELDSLLTKNKIKLVCIFSICPEAFCYTLSESAAVNVPVLAIDQGAVGQRVRDNNLGWLVKNGADIPEIYEKIRDIFNDKDGYGKISKSVSDYTVKNVDEMCGEYNKIYFTYAVDRKKNGINTEKLKKFIKDNYTISIKIDPLIESERYLTGELRNKTGHIEQLMESERQLSGELQNKTGHVEQLILSERRLNAEINSILTSRSWKIASKISALGGKIIPRNSKRRLFVKLILIFIRYPFRFISEMSTSRIRRFFEVLKKEGVSGVSRRINASLFNKGMPQYGQKIDIIEIPESPGEITDYEPIEFKKEENPIVSIIIPVYNKFNYTYSCLKSILNHSGGKTGYEIIIADDCSSDLTVDINKIVSNINVVKTPENFGFLKNCNNAARQARGKYVLFLNNDTQVQENWLFPLVELIEKDDSIGAVGSKLLFENGMLQEAGGIFWNDATAWNYGRMSDPALPEFNYVKEADYISGASLMIRKSVWVELGGFDEIFAPAYCEDADICFSMRKKGYKVLYQPSSVVVHFEGISNGTDISEGQKRYQVVNKIKFLNKWRDVLVRGHFVNGDNVFHARDRSRNKMTLLFIDHYVPHFDKDAGSRAVYQYLSFFVKNGFNVKFIGDNFVKHEPYTSILEQMGIEVLYGYYYSQNWKTWLKTNGRYIDYAILSRPHIAVKYIDEVRENTGAGIIFYGHDLHFLREIREYSVTKDEKTLKSSEKWKELELSLMRKSDVVYYFSTFESGVIKEIDPTINCRVVPLNIFPNKEFKIYNHERKDLVFVGGFVHYPNVDGIKWFVNDIFPVIREAIPGIILYVIGSNVPDEIRKLEKNDIKILGYIEDNILEEYYKKCKICIAPLRFGAGVKGKVLEAMYNQIPLMTTTIGAEGLPDIENCLIVEDDEGQFAIKLIELYNNDELLKDLEVKSFNYVMKNFTTDRVNDVLREDFTRQKKAPGGYEVCQYA